MGFFSGEHSKNNSFKGNDSWLYRNTGGLIGEEGQYANGTTNPTPKNNGIAANNEGEGKTENFMHDLKTLQKKLGINAKESNIVLEVPNVPLPIMDPNTGKKIGDIYEVSTKDGKDWTIKAIKGQKYYNAKNSSGETMLIDAQAFGDGHGSVEKYELTDLDLKEPRQGLRSSAERQLAKKTDESQTEQGFFDRMFSQIGEFLSSLFSKNSAAVPPAPGTPVAMGTAPGTGFSIGGMRIEVPPTPNLNGSLRSP